MAQERKEITPENITEALKEISSNPLGTALVNFIALPVGLKEANENRRTFAETLVTEWESGDHERRVNAVDALLIAFNAKLHGIQSRADEAYFKTLTVGLP